jgi:hypothetical protein
MKIVLTAGDLMLALFFGIYAMILELRDMKNFDQILYSGICILLALFAGK